MYKSLHTSKKKEGNQCLLQYWEQKPVREGLLYMKVMSYVGVSSYAKFVGLSSLR